MSRGRIWAYVIVGVAVLVLLANTLFVVDQREQAIVLRFGEPVRVVNAPGRPGAGLNVKAPFLENVGRFDRAAPGDLVPYDFDAKGLADLGPTLGERARLQHDGLAAARHEVHHGGFHGAGAGTGQYDHLPLGLKDFLQPGQHLGK